MGYGEGMTAALRSSQATTSDRRPAAAEGHKLMAGATLIGAPKLSPGARTATTTVAAPGVPSVHVSRTLPSDVESMAAASLSQAPTGWGADHAGAAGVAVNTPRYA